EESVGIEHLVAFVPIPGSMIFAAATLGYEVYLGAPATPVLRSIVAHLHFHFGDCVDVHRRAKNAAGAAITAVYTVGHDRSRIRAEAPEVRHVRSVEAAGELVIVSLGNTRQNTQHRNRIPAADRHHRELLGVQHRRILGITGLYGRTLRAHHDRFGYGAHFQLQRAHREARGGEHVVAFALKRPESSRV